MTITSAWRTMVVSVSMVLAMCAAASALDQSADLQVSAIIAPGCAVDGLGNSGNAGLIGRLEFGEASALSTGFRTADLSATQSIVLRCSSGLALQMSIDAGQNATAGQRHLRRSGGSERVAYQIYRDSGLTLPMGVGQPQAITVTDANFNNIRLPVFARASLPGPDARLVSGVYSDTVLVTLTW